MTIGLEVAVRLRGRHTVAGYRKPEGERGVVPSRDCGLQPDCLRYLQADHGLADVSRLCHLSSAALVVGVNPAMTFLPPTGPMFNRPVGMPSTLARRSADFTSTPT